MDKRISDYVSIKRNDKEHNPEQSNALEVTKSSDPENLAYRMSKGKAINDKEKKLVQTVVSKHQHLKEENLNLRSKLHQICSENIRLKELSDNQAVIGEVISVQYETETFYEKLTETAQKRSDISQNNVILTNENQLLTYLFNL